MNFAGLDGDAYIAIGFVGLLLVITVGLFAYVFAKQSRQRGQR